MRRLVRTTWFVGACLLGPAGCAGDDEPADPDETNDEPPAPPFLELTGPELEVSAAQTQEITAPVADLRDDTRIEIDGHSWLPGANGPASLIGDQLHVPLGGAMVVGTHELALVHRVGSDELRSDVLTISIVASTPGLLSAQLFDEPVVAGDRVLMHGQGVDAALALVDEAGARVHVWAGQWSAAGFELDAPGLVSAAASPIDAAGVLDLSITNHGDDRQLVLTWLAEDRRVVRARVAPIDPLGVPTAEPGEVLELWRLDDPNDVALLGPHELARLDAVALLDRMVVIAVDARRDAESPSLGDHVLITRWLSADGVPGEPVLVHGPNSRDIDLPADARLWTRGRYATALGVRVGLGSPWLLTLGTNGLPKLDGDPGELLTVPSSSTWMRSADAALGSRHVFTIDGNAASPHVRVLRLDRWGLGISADGETGDETGDETGGEPEPPPPTSELIELPAWPSGPPVLATFEGVPTLVLPMGAQANVLALRSTGADSRLDEIPDLRCDALALAGPGFDGVGDTLPLACLLDHQLRSGFVSSH